MISKDSIYDFIVYLVALGNNQNVTVFYANQDIKRPKGDYIVLYFTSPKTSIGTPTQKQGTDGLVYKDDFEATLSVHIYGENAEKIADDIHTFLDYDSSSRKAKELGLTYFNRGQLQDLTNMLGTRWLSRFQFDLFLRSKKISTDTSENYIESTNI